jgi:hypothetical protein
MIDMRELPMDDAARALARDFVLHQDAQARLRATRGESDG